MNALRRLGSPWAVILAGPVVGLTYFWVVYLLAEASCSGDLALLGTATLRTTVLATTSGAVAVLAAYAWRARRLWAAAPGSRDIGAGDVGGGEGADDRRQNRQFLLVTGLMLLGMFVVFALFMAAPVVGGSLCAAPS